MKIQVLSDLHLEFLRKGNSIEDLSSAVPVCRDAEVVIFAGDIDKGTHFIEMVNSYRLAGQQFIYVLGNHEGYGVDGWEHLVSECRTASEPISDWFHFLHRSIVVINGYTFMGATLWTDGTFGGADPIQTKALAERYINDYRLIKTQDRVLTFEDTVRWHEEDLRFLMKELERIDDPSRCVVVTHHLPHANSVDLKYKDSPLNPLFVSSLEESLFARATLWVHGHSHSSADYFVGDCRVVANPRGYPISHGKFENEFFAPHKIVEI